MATPDAGLVPSASPITSCDTCRSIPSQPHLRGFFGNLDGLRSAFKHHHTLELLSQSSTAQGSISSFQRLISTKPLPARGPTGNASDHYTSLNAGPDLSGEWDSIPGIMQRLETIFRSLEDYYKWLPSPTIKSLIDSYGNARGLLEAGIVACGDAWAPGGRDLKTVFAFTSLYSAVFDQLNVGAQEKKRNSWDGKREWEKAISRQDERSAFMELTGYIWPNSASPPMHIASQSAYSSSFGGAPTINTSEISTSFSLPDPEQQQYQGSYTTDTSFFTDPCNPPAHNERDYGHPIDNTNEVGWLKDLSGTGYLDPGDLLPPQPDVLSLCPIPQTEADAAAQAVPATTHSKYQQSDFGQESVSARTLEETGMFKTLLEFLEYMKPLTKPLSGNYMTVQDSPLCSACLLREQGVRTQILTQLRKRFKTHPDSEDAEYQGLQAITEDKLVRGQLGSNRDVNLFMHLAGQVSTYMSLDGRCCILLTHLR